MDLHARLKRQELGNRTCRELDPEADDVEERVVTHLGQGHERRSGGKISDVEVGNDERA